MYDNFRLRCLKSNGTAAWSCRLKQKDDDDDLSYEEKAQVVLDHLDTLAQMAKQLPESIWLETAAKAVETVQGLAISLQEREGIKQKA